MRSVRARLRQSSAEADHSSESVSHRQSGSISTGGHDLFCDFARDLQERLGILALLAFSAPCRICKLQIPLAARETDPVSGHRILSYLRNFLENRVTHTQPTIAVAS